MKSKKSIHNQNTFFFVPLGMLLLLYPPVASATVNISTKTNAQTYSDIQVRSNGNATVEVSNTTVINGEEFSYQFSSSSPQSIEHNVRIENGVVMPIAEKAPIILPDVSPSLPHAPIVEKVEAVIEVEEMTLPLISESHITEATLNNTENRTLWSWSDAVNYIYAYVKKLF